MQTSLSDEIAYVRDLAEAGQSAPLLGGRFLIWWGALITLVYAGHYVGATGQFGATTAFIPIVWGSFLVLGTVGQFAMIMTFPRNKPGAASVSNRVEGTVWGAGGFALGVYFGSLIIKSLVTGQLEPGFEASLQFVFAVYSIGLMTSGVIAGTKILIWAGYASLGMVALAIWFAGTPEIWLVGALAGCLTFLLPGIIMVIREPETVV